MVKQIWRNPKIVAHKMLLTSFESSKRRTSRRWAKPENCCSSREIFIHSWLGPAPCPDLAGHVRVGSGCGVPLSPSLRVCWSYQCVRFVSSVSSVQSVGHWLPACLSSYCVCLNFRNSRDWRERERERETEVRQKQRKRGKGLAQFSSSQISQISAP